MAKGRLGAELDSRLNIASDYIQSKKKEDAFSNSDLDSILIKSEISRLFIVGLNAAHCLTVRLIL
jgi:nicotinamidase-related amidase